LATLPFVVSAKVLCSEQEVLAAGIILGYQVSGLYLNGIFCSPTHAAQSAAEHTTQKLKNANDK
jgi:hypothetical protein